MIRMQNSFISSAMHRVTLIKSTQRSAAAAAGHLMIYSAVPAFVLAKTVTMNFNIISFPTLLSQEEEEEMPK